MLLDVVKMVVVVVIVVFVVVIVELIVVDESFPRFTPFKNMTLVGCVFSLNPLKPKLSEIYIFVFFCYIAQEKRQKTFLFFEFKIKPW